MTFEGYGFKNASIFRPIFRYRPSRWGGLIDNRWTFTTPNSRIKFQYFKTISIFQKLSISTPSPNSAFNKETLGNHKIRPSCPSRVPYFSLWTGRIILFEYSILRKTRPPKLAKLSLKNYSTNFYHRTNFYCCANLSPRIEIYLFHTIEKQERDDY